MKIAKNFIILCITALIAIYSTFTALADTPLVPLPLGSKITRSLYEWSDSDDISKQVPGMMNNLYFNEPDFILRQMAVDYALVLTGIRQPQDVFGDGTALIGVYLRRLDMDVPTCISLIGKYPLQMGFLSDDQTTIFTDQDEPLTEEAYQKNINDLKKIYNIVMQAKKATAGLDDEAKLKYIEDYIYTLVPVYVEDCDPVIIHSIENGYCDCDGYAALTYLLGINCGLNINNISGYVRRPELPHAWNEVTVNGVTYWHDTTYDLNYRSGDDRPYLLVSPEEMMATEGYVVNNQLNENTTITKVYVRPKT